MRLSLLCMLRLTHGDMKYNPRPKKKLTMPTASWHEANFIY